MKQLTRQEVEAVVESLATGIWYKVCEPDCIDEGCEELGESISPHYDIF